MNNININDLNFNPGEKPDEKKVDRYLESHLTELYKFITYVDPNTVSVNCKFDNAETQLTGDAKKMIDAEGSKAEKYLTEKIITISDQRFSTPESVLDFVSGNKDLLKVMSENGEFRKKVFDKLSKLVIFAQEKEKTAGVVERLFIWKPILNRSKKVYSELTDQFDGPMSPKIMYQYFNKNQSWNGAEWIRSLQSLASKLIEINDMDIEILEKHEKLTSRVTECQQCFLAGWKGLYKRGNFDGRDIEKRDERTVYVDDFKQRFDHIFHLINDKSVHKKMRELVFKTILDSADFDETKRFIEAYLNKNSEGSDVSIQIEREQAMLRCVPEKYVVDLMQNKSSRTTHEDLSLATLYFVESIKKGDAAGIVNSSNFLKNFETNEGLFAHTLNLGMADSLSPYGTMRLLKNAKYLLTPDEFKLFLNNYNPTYKVDLEHLDEWIEYIEAREAILNARYHESVGGVFSRRGVTTITEEDVAQMIKKGKGVENASEVNEEAAMSLSEPQSLEEEHPGNINEEVLMHFVNDLKDDITTLRVLQLQPSKIQNVDMETLRQSIAANLKNFFDLHQINTAEDRRNVIENRLNLLPEEKQRVYSLLFPSTSDVRFEPTDEEIDDLLEELGSWDPSDLIKAENVPDSVQDKDLTDIEARILKLGLPNIPTDRLPGSKKSKIREKGA